MIRYYCSGLDANNAFGHGLGDMFKSELKSRKSIVYIPGAFENCEKAKVKYVPIFTKNFKNVGIEFETVNILTPDLTHEQATQMLENADFLVLMGGCPFKQKQLCEKLGIIQQLKNYRGIMLGISAGAMLMSKYIATIPCSEEYPDFRIENGLNLDGLSIFPHNNVSSVEYPDKLVSGCETYKKSDLITLAKKCSPLYLLQDNLRSDGLTDVSIIKSSDGKIEFYIENDGKIWQVDKDIHIVNTSRNSSDKKVLHIEKIQGRD